mgnify:CR=1 FL=1
MENLLIKFNNGVHMKKTMKIYLYLISFLFLFLGAISFIDPTGEMFVMKFGVIPDPSHPAHGLNSLRGFFGGAIFSFGVMIILGYRTLNKTWFDAVALSMALLIFGRVIAFIIDGFDPLSLGGFIGEVITIPVLLYAGKTLKEA